MQRLLRKHNDNNQQDDVELIELNQNRYFKQKLRQQYHQSQQAAPRQQHRYEMLGNNVQR